MLRSLGLLLGVLLAAGMYGCVRVQARPVSQPTPSRSSIHALANQSTPAFAPSSTVCSSGYRIAATMSGADGFEGPRRKVLVTGAAGRTGSLVFKKLQAKPGA